MSNKQETFYLINQGKVERHIRLWGYVDWEASFTMFKAWPQIHTINNEQVYANVDEAQEALIKRLGESADENLALAEKIEKDWIEVIDRTVEEKE